MALHSYLYFKGNCREALAFYADVFKTENPKIMSFGDMPVNGEFPLTDEMKKLVLHSELDLFGGKIMFSDVPEGMPFVIGNNISFVISSNDLDEVKTLFRQLQVGGTVTMDLQETFWSKSYGMLIDQFGVSWQISYAE